MKNKNKIQFITAAAFTLISIQSLRAQAQTNVVTGASVCNAYCYHLQSDGLTLAWVESVEAVSYDSSTSAFSRLKQFCDSGGLLLNRKLSGLTEANDSDRFTQTIGYVIQGHSYQSGQYESDSYTLNRPHTQIRFQVTEANARDSCKDYKVGELPALEQAWGHPLGG